MQKCHSLLLIILPNSDSEHNDRVHKIKNIDVYTTTVHIPYKNVFFKKMRVDDKPGLRKRLKKLKMRV